MPFSYNEVGSVSAGGTLQVPFPYLDRSHVFVSVDGVDVSAAFYHWASNTMIEILSGFPAGNRTKISRRTPSSGLVARLEGAAAYDYTTLRDNFTQILYVLQERVDQDLLDAAVVDDLVASMEGIESNISTVNAAVASAQAAVDAAQLARDEAAQAAADAAQSEVSGKASLADPGEFTGDMTLPFAVKVQNHPSYTNQGGALLLAEPAAANIPGFRQMGVFGDQFRFFANDAAAGYPGAFIDLGRAGAAAPTSGVMAELAFRSDVPAEKSVTGIAELKAVDHTIFNRVYLFHPTRHGAFVWYPGDWSGAGDLHDGVHVASNSDPAMTSGAWVRLRESRVFRPEWWGGGMDNGTSDDTAFQHMRAYYLAVGGGTIMLGPKSYYLDGWDVVYDQHIIGLHIVGSGIDRTRIVVPNGGWKGVRLGTVDGGYFVRGSISSLTITRNGSSVPAGCVGLLAEHYNYVVERDVKVEYFDVSRHITGKGGGDISIQYEAFGPYSTSAQYCDWKLENAAGIHIYGGETGQNGGDAFNRDCCLLITGECNDVWFTCHAFIPRGPGPAKPALCKFVDYTNTTGYIQFTACNTENVSVGFDSVNTPVITELAIHGGRWAVEQNLFDLDNNTKVQFSNFANFNTGQGFILPNVGYDVRIMNVQIGGAFSLTASPDGGSCRVIGCNRPPTLSGTWSSQGVGLNG